MSEPELEKIVIIGAGPIGIEAALYARFLGYPTSVLEQGDHVATHVRRWGHVRLFSPFGMNHSSLGRANLLAHWPDCDLPGPEETITGQDWVEKYLEPLAQSDLLRKNILFGQRVVKVGRTTLKPTDAIGQNPVRADDEFRLLIESEAGERFESAEFVIDTTGTLGSPNFLGAGSSPALGERAIRESLSTNRDENQSFLEHGISYHHPDFVGLGEGWRDKKILVIGRGYSAATHVVQLGQLAEKQNLSVDWATTVSESHENLKDPMYRIEEDSLAARDELAAQANSMVQAKRVNWRPNCWVQKIAAGKNARFEIEFVKLSEDGTEMTVDDVVEYDFVVANVGYHANNQMLSSLQYHPCYATGGPMNWSAALLSQSSADCTQVHSGSSDTILTSEPNFFVLGSKSYGRNPQFLFANGLEQIRQAFAKIVGREDLNLYQSVQADRSNP